MSRRPGRRSSVLALRQPACGPAVRLREVPPYELAMPAMFSQPEFVMAKRAGIQRRDFLKIGALGMGGLSLAQLLAAESQAGIKSSQKSVIMIYLVGGPPHQDMFDLKPDAPAEIAGPLGSRSRPTSPASRSARRCRSWPGSWTSWCRSARWSMPRADHDAFQCFTGHHPQARAGRRLAAIRFRRRQNARAGRFRRAAVHQPVLPLHARPLQRAGSRISWAWLWRRCGRPDPAATTWCCTASRPARLADRKTLLASIDRLRRDLDASGKMHGMDAFNEQAMDVLTSSRLAEALDLSKEDPRVVARYGTGDETVFMDGNGAPRVPQSLLAGPAAGRGRCRVVTLNYSKWDWHGGAEQLHLQSRGRRLSGLRQRHDGPGRGPARARPRQGRDGHSWASSAARRRSATRSAATIGRGSTGPCWPAAA